MQKRLILISLFLFLLFPITVQAEEKEKDLIIQKTEVIVIADELNIRSTPNTNLDPIDSVPFGTSLYAIDGCMEQNWIAIYYNNQVRFVNDKYIVLKTEYDQNKDSYSKTYLGEYKITHYCNCSKCCGKWAGGNTASGVPPVAGVTVACGSLPFGTKIEINGHVYTVQDRGVNGKWIDIYCGSHGQALSRGMYTTSVYLIN